MAYRMASSQACVLLMASRHRDTGSSLSGSTSASQRLHTASQASARSGISQGAYSPFRPAPPIARGECRKLDSSGVEEPVGGNEECVGPVARNSGEGRLDLPAGAGVDDLNLQSEGACSFRYVSYHEFGNRVIGRIDQHG